MHARGTVAGSRGAQDPWSRPECEDHGLLGKTVECDGKVLAGVSAL